MFLKITKLKDSLFVTNLHNNATDLIKTKNYLIKNVSNKVFKNPVAPFTTSTLQQSASGKYGFGASELCKLHKDFTRELILMAIL